MVKLPNFCTRNEKNVILQKEVESRFRDSLKRESCFRLKQSKRGSSYMF